MTDGFTPFADDSSVWQSGSLSVENGTREVLLHGSVSFGPDPESAARARALAGMLLAVAERIEEGVPEVGDASPAAAVDIVPNPFA